MNSEQAAIPTIIGKSQRAVIISYYALLCTFTVNSILQIPGDGNITVIGFLWVLKVVPLLIFAPGLRRRHLRTYAWLSFVVLLYFVLAVQTAFVEATRIYGIIITLLLSVLFCTLVIYIRSFRNFYKTSL